MKPPLASSRNGELPKLIVPPWTTVCDNPRISSIPPRVTMKGCSLSRVMSNPCPRPISRATAKATGIPIHSGYPSPPVAGEDSLAMITPVRPTTEPIDRSMPPVMITKPMPIAKIPSIEICRIVLSTLDCPRKSGFEIHSTRHMSTSATNIPSSRLMRR